MRDSGRDVRQGFDMVRGIRCAGVVPCSEQNPCVYGVREVGSANRSELEARPNGCQKGKEGVYRGLSRRRRTGRNAANRRAWFCISEKEFTKTPNCPSCCGQGVVCRSELWRRDWVLACPAPKTTRCDVAIKPAASASARCQQQDADKLHCSVRPALEGPP
jgi:hypothetical protein